MSVQLYHGDCLEFMRTLDTIDQWYWGTYKPTKRPSA